MQVTQTMVATNRRIHIPEAARHYYYNHALRDQRRP